MKLGNKRCVMDSTVKHAGARAVTSPLVSIVTLLFGLLAATEYASSADLSLAPAATAAPAVYNWNGLYLGVNAGYGSGADTTTASGGGASALASANVPGFIGGAQIGVNYQTGVVVWGFEADFDASTQNQSLTSGVLSGTSQMPWFGTLRGRLGVAFDRLLIYGTAGGAAGELRSNFTIPAGGSSTTVTYGTWTAGGGLEYGLTDNLSARVEYLYLDTGNVNTGSIGPPATAITSRVQNNLVRAGLNYRFPVAW
jgi:outer membrane immunogenic protein